MPDDSSGKPVEQKTVQHVEPIEASDTNLSPNIPDAHPAQPVTNEAMEGQIEDIQDRVKRGEWWMIGLTAAIALFALCSIGVGLLQWNVMKAQLREMHDGGVDTHNLAVAAGTQAVATQDLANRMKDEAGATQQMADDNGNLLRGTQAASMDFSVSADVLSGTVNFFGSNAGGKVQARDVRADLVTTIRSWPSKNVRLGPFHHPLIMKQVVSRGGPQEGMQDSFTIPNITPEISKELATGAAYIAVDWQASYDDGFGTVVHWPPNRTCDAYMYVGHVKCQTGPRSYLDNDIRGDAICGGIDTLRKRLEDGMAENQKQCQNPN